MVPNPLYMVQFQFFIEFAQEVGVIMEMDDRVLKAGLEHILEIANERKAILEKLKEALITDDVDSVKVYAKWLCGLSNES